MSIDCCTAGAQQQRRANADSATFSAYVGSWTQTLSSLLDALRSWTLRASCWELGRSLKARCRYSYSRASSGLWHTASLSFIFTLFNFTGSDCDSRKSSIHISHTHIQICFYLFIIQAVPHIFLPQALLHLTNTDLSIIFQARQAKFTVLVSCDIPAWLLNPHLSPTACLHRAMPHTQQVHSHSGCSPQLISHLP